MSTSLVFSSPDDGVLVAPRHCGLLAIPALLQQVQSWCITTRRSELIVDLSQTETLEAGALRALLWARRHCLSRGLTVAVVLPPAGVRRSREAMLLRDLFTPDVGPSR